MLNWLKLDVYNVKPYNGNCVAHEFAYDEDGVMVHHLDAKYGVYYRDSRNNRMVLKAENSIYKIAHFSYLPEYKYERTESNTIHKEVIDKIFNDGYLDIDDMRITPDNIIVEKATIDGSEIIPDLTFYNDKWEILCIVEVAVTHKCELRKIRELKERNILTFELFYDGKSNEYKGYHCFGNKELERKDKEFKREFRDQEEGYEGEISKRERDYRETGNRVQAASHFIKMEERKHKSAGVEYGEIKQRIYKIKADIQYLNERINYIQSDNYDKSKDDYRPIEARAKDRELLQMAFGDIDEDVDIIHCEIQPKKKN